jgi:hypothetical protein
MGRAASELIRRGACYQLGTRKLNGLPVFDAPDDFPAITTERVRELLDRSSRHPKTQVTDYMAVGWKHSSAY